jgi:hypothetical protein
MDIAEKIAEAKILDALENVEFDNLSCKGQPIDFREYFKAPPHLRMAFSLLKNAGIIPPEMELKKEIERLKELQEACRDIREVRHLQKEINLKTTLLNTALERRRNSFLSAGGD